MIAEVRVAERAETISMASSSVGNAMRMSSRAETVSSNQPCANAATRPSVMPTTAAIRTDPSPAAIAILDPVMSCVSRSRPSLSVPIRCPSPGPASRPPEVSEGSYGSQKREMRAMSAMSPARTHPVHSVAERFIGRLPRAGRAAVGR